MKKIGIFWGSSTDNTTVATEFMKEYLEMKRVIHGLLENQFLEEKQTLIAQKQILKELKHKRTTDQNISTKNIEQKLFLLERRLNLKGRRLSFAEKLL